MTSLRVPDAEFVHRGGGSPPRRHISQRVASAHQSQLPRHVRRCPPASPWSRSRHHEACAVQGTYTNALWDRRRARREAELSGAQWPAGCYNRRTGARSAIMAIGVADGVVPTRREGRGDQRGRTDGARIGRPRRWLSAGSSSVPRSRAYERRRVTPEFSKKMIELRATDLDNFKGCPNAAANGAVPVRTTRVNNLYFFVSPTCFGPTCGSERGFGPTCYKYTLYHCG